MCTIPRQLLPSVCGVKVYPHGLRCTLKLLTCLTFNDAAAVAEEELGVGVLVCEVKQPSAAADHSLSQVGLVQNFCWVSWRLCCRTLPALSGLSHEDEQTVPLPLHMSEGAGSMLPDSCYMFRKSSSLSERFSLAAK